MDLPSSLADELRASRMRHLARAASRNAPPPPPPAAANAANAANANAPANANASANANANATSTAAERRRGPGELEDAAVTEAVVRELVLDYLIFSGARGTARAFVVEATSKLQRPALAEAPRAAAARKPAGGARSAAGRTLDADDSVDALRSGSSAFLSIGDSLPLSASSQTDDAMAVDGRRPMSVVAQPPLPEFSLASLEQRPVFRTLELRQKVERLILEGNIAVACHECEHHCPGIFAAAGPNRGVYFGLLCQQFIEYIRSGCDKEALTLAQRELAEFGYEDSGNLAKLTDIVALLAYADPANSPLGGYLQPRRREELAASVSAAIMRHNGGRPYALLERLVRQTVVVREAVAGGVGASQRLVRQPIGSMSLPRFSFSDYVATEDSSDAGGLWKKP